jgi:hypothetical protein
MAGFCDDMDEPYGSLEAENFGQLSNCTVIQGYTSLFENCKVCPAK